MNARLARIRAKQAKRREYWDRRNKIRQAQEYADFAERPTVVRFERLSRTYRVIAYEGVPDADTGRIFYPRGK